jgi:aromatic ring-cleaving dioxygenase
MANNNLSIFREPNILSNENVFSSDNSILTDNTDSTDNNTAEINLCDDLNLSKWKSYKFTSNKDTLEKRYGTFRIIKKNLTKDSNKPDLVAMAGFSKKSFCGTTKRIIENIDQIKNIFNAIYILQFDEEKIKDLQSKACSIRDEIRKSKDEADFEENLEEIYQSETDLNEELGIIVDKLLRSIGLTKVHLLGKCAGGGVAIHVLTKSNIYDALYLGVPASPTAIKHLTINYKNIHNKLLIFTWDQRDAYQFDWNKKSNEEITRYENYVPNIKFNYNIIITKRFHMNTNETDPKNFHEVPNGLFKLINKNNNTTINYMVDLCHFGENSAPGIIINDILKDKKYKLFMLGVYNFNDILSYLKDGNYENIYDKKNLIITPPYNEVIHKKYNFIFQPDYKVIKSQIINYDFARERFDLKIKNFKEMLSSPKLCVFIVFTMQFNNLEIKEMLDWLSLNKKHFHLIIFTPEKDVIPYNSKLYSIITLTTHYNDWWRTNRKSKINLYNEIYKKFINCLKQNKIEHNFPLTFDSSILD